MLLAEATSGPVDSQDFVSLMLVLVDSCMMIRDAHTQNDIYIYTYMYNVSSLVVHTCTWYGDVWLRCDN